MVAEESHGSMQWFHFFDGIFLGQWYPEGFHAKSMVLKRFTRRLLLRGIHGSPPAAVEMSTGPGA